VLYPVATVISIILSLLAGTPAESVAARPQAPFYPPVKQTNCFAMPSSCGFPAPSTTGVPKGQPLQPSGSITVTKSGTVVSGVDVTGTIDVEADDVTIEDSRVTQNTTCGPTAACGNYAIRIGEGHRGIKIKHVETRSEPGDTCQQDIRNTGAIVTIEYAYMHACDGNVYAVGPTLIKDSYGKAKIGISTDHIENVYMNETSVKAIHDTLLNPVEQTAVIFGNSGGGTDVPNCSNRITVLGSLLAGGGYSIYPCAHAGAAGSSYINIQGNHFARCLSKEVYDPEGGHHPCAGGPDSHGYYPNSGSYGIAAYYFGGTGTWRGNVWDNNLSKVCIDGSTVRRTCGAE
jgi:hypothetical protein